MEVRFLCSLMLGKSHVLNYMKVAVRNGRGAWAQRRR